jgi:hypothetical protein
VRTRLISSFQKYTLFGSMKKLVMKPSYLLVGNRAVL